MSRLIDLGFKRLSSTFSCCPSFARSAQRNGAEAFQAVVDAIRPESIERSTYVLFSSLALILLFSQWRPIPAVVWHIDNPQIAAAVMGLSLAGWLIVLTSTFSDRPLRTRSGWNRSQIISPAGRCSQPGFRTPLYYKFVRHPLYLGFIIAFWATPTMTVGHLLFAAVTTAYILVGIMLEERDLIALFGDDYRRYKERGSARC